MRHQLGQSKTALGYRPELTIEVLRAAAEEGFRLIPTIYVHPVGREKRIARAGEVSVWLDKRGTISWDEKWRSPLLTDANGQVGWETTGNWPGDRYRLVAQHAASGAKVTKIFEIDGNQVTLEEPQVQDKPGSEMPADFLQHLPDWERKPHYPYYRGNGA